MTPVHPESVVPADFRATASAAMVNRTHRIVRERAKSMQARKTMARSLWIPLTLCAIFIPVIVFAVWSVLEQNEVTPTGLPDSSQQILVLLMWCFPLTLASLAIVWFRHGSKSGSSSASGTNFGGNP